MKTVAKIFLYTVLTLLLSSCSLLYSLFSGEHEENTKVDRVTSTFSLSNSLVFINNRSNTDVESTFVIDADNMDIVSRIYYTNGKYEIGASQVSPYNGKLWILGACNAHKVLIFNTETGKTEETISFTEWNCHRMNFLPSINRLAIMHGNRYEKGCSISLINLSTHKYEKLAYIQQLAPQLVNMDGKIYGSGNHFEPREERGFGTYSFRDETFDFNKEFSVCSSTDSVGSQLVDVNKFLVLSDGTYVVCDDTIGIKIQYPDSSIGKIWYGEETDDYRRVDNIYYSDKYNRIYVEGGKGYRISYLEKDQDGKWERSENFMEAGEYHGFRASMLNGDTWVTTYPSDDRTMFHILFYHISDLTLKKEICWNLSDDTKTENNF